MRRLLEAMWIRRPVDALLAVVWLAAFAGIGVWMAWRIGALG